MNNLPCTLCDMNIEALEFLLHKTTVANDTWSKRAFNNIDKNLHALRWEKTYGNRDKYRRAVSDINRVLEISGRRCDVQLSLANYQDNTLSPLNSRDLLEAAANFESNLFYPYFSDRFETLLFRSDSTFAGFSLNYLSQALTTFAMIGYLKRHHPKIRIVIGGGLATTWLSHPRYDEPFHAIVDHFIAGKGEEPLVRLLTGRTSHVGSSGPDFTQFNKQSYLSPRVTLPVASSYGCYWRKCNFCPEKSEANPYMHNHPDQTATELDILSRHNRPMLIHFLDNAISPTTLQMLATRQQRVTPWYGFVRFNHLLADKNFCFQLKKSGCAMLKIGLESGDSRVLEAMNKGIDLQLASTALKNLREAGIGTYIYLLFGTPEEDREAAFRTMDFVLDHHLEISFLNLSIFNLPLCAREASDLEVSKFYDGDLSIYRQFVHPKGWNRGDIRRFLEKDFKRNEQIAAILLRDPPSFGSNHAPFFL
nr:radical SAM protein [Desulforhopalus singaporensis]